MNQLKPFDRERLVRAVGRARERIRGARAGEAAERLGALLRELKPAGDYARRVHVKAGGRTLILPLAEIDWVRTADNYLQIHAGKRIYMIRETMSQFESRLDPKRFVRIHRTTLVNLDRVRALQPLCSGDQAVVLHDGTKLTMSRTYRDKVLSLLK